MTEPDAALRARMTPEQKLNRMRRIKMILEQAQGEGVTPGEAEQFTARATELLAKYGIDQALLDAVATDKTTIEAITWLDPIHCAWPYARSKASLLTTVASAYRCDSVHLQQPSAKYKYELYVAITGFPVDLERTQVLFTSLLLQSAAEMAATPVPYGRQKAAWRDTWLYGYGQAVGDRLRAAEHKAADEPGVAIVLRNRDQQVHDELARKYPSLKYTTRHLTGTGHGNGYAAGQRADLSGPAVTTGQRAVR